MKSASPEPPRSLRVLIANEAGVRLQTISDVVHALGYEIVGRDSTIANVGPLSRSTGADVALVGLGLDGEHALDQIAAIVHEAACPVIALLDVDDASYVDKAAARGVYAYVVLNGKETADLQSALDVTLRRYTDLQNLRGAFARRAIIEQAKGILMAHNGIDADAAYDRLKSHSQRTGKKLSDVAFMVTQSQELLPSTESRARSPR
jgi:two-component system, response regulator / RNA-binding antiterminator